MDTELPVNWAIMTSKQIGSASRNTNEPGGSKLLISFDDATALSILDPLALDFIDFGLPSLQASAYSTALLAQRKWATMGVSRIISGDQIQGTIECSGATYTVLAALIGAKGTCRIEIPTQGWFSQWRIALLSVAGPSIADGDRMTGSITLTVTNTAPDDKSEMGPVFGTFPAYVPSIETGISGPTMTPAA